MSVTYTLRYREVGASTWTTITGLSSKTATVTGLQAGVRYEVEITASGPGGESLPAAAARTTKCVAPAQPTASNVLAETASVSWSAVTGASSYKVFRDGVEAGTTSGTSLTVSGMTESNTHSVTVVAVNEDNDVSDQSTARSISTTALATGGTVSNITVGSVAYRVHTFSTTGSSSFVLNATRTVEHLIVGGGGGGGGGGFNDGRDIVATAPSYSYVGGFGGGGGGGGAGQVVSGSASRAANTYTVVVGAKGVGGEPKTGGWDVGCAGESGEDSSVFGLTASQGIGGHGGGNFNGNSDAYANGTSYKTGATNLVVGSGGGGGTSGSGFAGGAASLWTSWERVGAQGASSSSAGASPATTRYGVVAGTSSSISGTSVRYGDGGGGGSEWGVGTTGSRSTTAGSGGGGGEGRFAGTDGRDGIVILRYPV